MAPVHEDIRGDALDSNMEAILAMVIMKKAKVVTLNNALVSEQYIPHRLRFITIMRQARRYVFVSPVKVLNLSMLLNEIKNKPKPVSNIDHVRFSSAYTCFNSSGSLHDRL